MVSIKIIWRVLKAGGRLETGTISQWNGAATSPKVGLPREPTRDLVGRIPGVFPAVNELLASTTQVDGGRNSYYLGQEQRP